MDGARNQFRVVAAVMICILLNGCVPIPIGSDYERFGRRENLGDSVPGFIVSGKTTRSEVLLALGEADGRALDESWLSYGCAIARGGVEFILYPLAAPATESLEYRRLVVYFDEAGVVERTGFEMRICQETSVRWPGGEESRPQACLDAAGRDLPMVRERR